MRNRVHDFPTSTLLQVSEDVIELWKIWHKRKYPTSLFLLLCLNLIVAPVVQAATGSEVLSRSQAYALALLGITTIALSVYLFVAMFQPERF
jgi:K+-transporting ATPase KdpF subunit